MIHFSENYAMGRVDSVLIDSYYEVNFINFSGLARSSGNFISLPFKESFLTVHCPLN